MQALANGFTPAVFLKRETAVKDDFFGGEEVSTPDGDCLKYETVHSITPYKISEDKVRERLMKDLTIIQGIGKVRAAEFKKKGILTIQELRHTRFKETAKETAEIISEGTPKEITSMMREFHRGNDPLLLGFSAQNSENHIFFDIETLGMGHSPIILFGCGELDGSELKVTQYLLRNIEEELPALMLTAKHFKKEKDAVTYNGRAFDIPYLNERLAYYGERNVSIKMHFDLLYPTRKIFSQSLPNCCLGTVENYLLGLKRQEDLPGYLVPVYYKRYLWTKNADILEPIVEHNEADVANLARLLNHHLEFIYG
ncbi:MAG: ribonuclease H-like domain-containing protein [Methanocorpusculum sp.]|nr:ribonuclease H-like domain-containing protein [Methanocorpusculum sp.]